MKSKLTVFLEEFGHAAAYGLVNLGSLRERKSTPGYHSAGAEQGVARLFRDRERHIDSSSPRSQMDLSLPDDDRFAWG